MYMVCTFFASRLLANLSPLLDHVFGTETALDIPQDRFFIKIYVPSRIRPVIFQFHSQESRNEILHGGV